MKIASVGRAFPGHYYSQEELIDLISEQAPDGQFHFEMGRRLAVRLGYSPSDLEEIPAASVDSFAGVGYHFDLANLQPGENVLDLGNRILEQRLDQRPVGRVVEKHVRLRVALSDHRPFPER